MKKLHTLFVISRYWPCVGGAELHTRQLAHQLSQKQQVTVLYFNERHTLSNELGSASAKNRDFYDANVRTIQVAPQGFHRFLLFWLALIYPYISCSRPIYQYLMFLFARARINQFSHDVDVIHNVYNGLTSVTKASIWVARKRLINIIWSPLTSYTHPEGQAWSSKQFKGLYQQVDSIIALTPFEKNWLQQRGVDRSLIKVIPMAPLLDETASAISFRRQYQLTDKPVVLFLGRHVYQKGYHLLLAAMDQVWRDSPETHFVFIGPQTDQSKKNFSDHQNQKVIIIDEITQQQKTAALAECDLLCVPSFNEGLGVVYLEAWHFGKPVIACDIPLLQTIIIHQKDGLLVKPDKKSVADAILELIVDPEKARQMGCAGQQKVKKTYQWDLLARSLHNHYQDLLDQDLLVST